MGIRIHHLDAVGMHVEDAGGWLHPPASTQPARDRCPYPGSLGQIVRHLDAYLGSVRRSSRMHLQAPSGR